MKKLLPFLLLFSLPAQALTLSWCPVKGNSGAWLMYDVCIESNPSVGDCSVLPVRVIGTSYSFTIQNGQTVAFRVRAAQFMWDSLTYQYKSTFSQYSNPLMIIGGITPPVVSCACN